MITVYGQNTKLGQLADVEMVRPDEAGKRWQGVPHTDLAHTIINEVDSRGWGLGKMSFSLSKDQADLAGAFELFIPDLPAPEGQTFSLGVLSSNMRRRSLHITVGTNVTVCNNGMCTGEIILNKHHTKGLNLTESIEVALDDYLFSARRVEKMVEGLRARNITETEAEHVLMQAGRQGLMPWSRIGKVDKEYRAPTFADHDERTSWGLLNAFTHIAKANPIHNQMSDINDFRQLLPTIAAA